MFKWHVEFQVGENWVADGFEMTDEVALAMLAKQLGWAIEGTELKARVTKKPSVESIRIAQGYEPARWRSS